MTPAAAYVRASTEHQRYSTANQSAALEEYATGHGLTIAKTYVDEGRSGLDIRGRPGLRSLIQHVVQPDRRFQVLLVYDVSRWGRFQDPDESAYYEFLCRQAGVDLVYCAEAFTAEHGAMAALMKNIKRTMAAEYSRELSDKVAAGKRRLAALGFAQANSSFGFRRGLVDQNRHLKAVLEPGQRKSIQTDRIVFVAGPPKEVAVVRLIFRLFVRSGLRFSEVADELNRRGIASPAGGRWQGQGVRRILRNEQYAGALVYGLSSQRLRGGAARTPPGSWTRVEDAHERIVSKRLFARAQVRMRALSRRPGDADFLPKLRALFEREGYLTPTLINAQTDMPNAQAFCWRFSGLVNAYRAVGYLSPRDASENWTFDRPDTAARQQLLSNLNALLEREGYLTADLINDEPTMPSFRVYQWAFGSLHAAYELIGYQPPKTGRLNPRTRSTPSP